MKYLDEKLSFEERAKDLVAQMTLEEKISQTVYNAPPIERLGVPAYNWWNEALHGVARAGVATVFPQAIGLAATWNDELINSVADVISTEGRAKFNAVSSFGDRGIYKGLTYWSPNINIFRDPRWGRGHETYGEDPFLTSRLGVAFVKGLQGSDPKYLKSAACAKHFAVHSGPEGLRHEFNAVVSKKDLYETYLPAFKACVTEAKVEAIMGAYNRTNGEPCCGSDLLLSKILRGEWGFGGHVVSDCWAIRDFHERHCVTATAIESVALAINNGCDLNCGNMYLNLMIAYNEGLVTEETITKAVERLMTTRMKLGLFDSKESVSFNNISFDQNDTPQNTQFNFEVAKQSLVLLKNKDGVLPLDHKEIKSIAVVGPNSASKIALEGNYCGTASQYITLLDGIRDQLNENARLYYSEGCHLYKENISSPARSEKLAEAAAAARTAELTVICLGLDSTIEGEEGDVSKDYSSGDKKDLCFPKPQTELLDKVAAVCKAEGKPLILVVMSGSAMDLAQADEKADAVIQAWYPGAQGGRAVASLIFGGFSPSGRLPVTFYRTTEELPDFTDYSMKNRTYRYMENEALYPFGFGLSYTKFKYGRFEVLTGGFKDNGTVTVKVSVKNTEKIDGREIVQLYISDIEASVVVPRWSLKGFKAVYLQANEEKEIIFTITKDDFSIFNGDGEQVFEPGEFDIFIGGSQPDRRSLSLTGSEVLKQRIFLTF